MAGVNYNDPTTQDLLKTWLKHLESGGEMSIDQLLTVLNLIGGQGNKAKLFKLYIQKHQISEENLLKIILRFTTDSDKKDIITFYLEQKKTISEENFVKIILGFTDDFYKKNIIKCYLEQKNTISEENWLKIISKFTEEYDKKEIITFYLEQKNTISEEKFLEIVSKFTDDKDKKHIITFYLEQKNTISEENFVKIILGFTTDPDKKHIITFYLKQENKISQENFVKIILGFIDDLYKNSIIKLYLEQKNTISEENLLKIISGFTTDFNKKNIITFYLEQKNTISEEKFLEIISKFQNNKFTTDIIALYLEKGNKISEEKFLEIFSKFKFNNINLYLLEIYMEQGNKISKKNCRQLVEDYKNTEFKNHILYFILNAQQISQQFKNQLISTLFPEAKGKTIIFYTPNSKNPNNKLVKFIHPNQLPDGYTMGIEYEDRRLVFKDKANNPKTNTPLAYSKLTTPYLQENSNDVPVLKLHVEGILATKQYCLELITNPLLWEQIKEKPYCYLFEAVEKLRRSDVTKLNIKTIGDYVDHFNGILETILKRENQPEHFEELKLNCIDRYKDIELEVNVQSQAAFYQITSLTPKLEENSQNFIRTSYYKYPDCEYDDDKMRSQTPYAYVYDSEAGKMIGLYAYEARSYHSNLGNAIDIIMLLPNNRLHESAQTMYDYYIQRVHSNPITGETADMAPQAKDYNQILVFKAEDNFFSKNIAEDLTRRYEHSQRKPAIKDTFLLNEAKLKTLSENTKIIFVGELTQASLDKLLQNLPKSKEKISIKLSLKTDINPDIDLIQQLIEKALHKNINLKVAARRNHSEENIYYRIGHGLCYPNPIPIKPENNNVQKIEYSSENGNIIINNKPIFPPKYCNNEEVGIWKQTDYSRYYKKHQTLIPLQKKTSQKAR